MTSPHPQLPRYSSSSESVCGLQERKGQNCLGGWDSLSCTQGALWWQSLAVLLFLRLSPLAFEKSVPLLSPWKPIWSSTGSGIPAQHPNSEADIEESSSGQWVPLCAFLPSCPVGIYTCYYQGPTSQLCDESHLVFTGLTGILGHLPVSCIGENTTKISTPWFSFLFLIPNS